MAAVPFAGVLNREKIRFFFEEHNCARVASCVVAHTTALAGVIVDKKTPLAELYFFEVIKIARQSISGAYALREQMERKPRRLARADRGKIGKRVNKISH